MKEAFELLDGVVLKAFELVADGWNNFNGIDGFAEFIASLSHVHYSEEEIYDYAVNAFEPAPPRIQDEWIEELHSRWFTSGHGDRFWSVFKRLDPDNKKAFLTWLAMKQAQREHA